MARNDSFNQQWASAPAQFERPGDGLIARGWAGGASEDPPEAKWENWWHNRVDLALQELQNLGQLMWFADAPYQVGTRVNHGGNSYIALSENTGVEPTGALDVGVWRQEGINAYLQTINNLSEIKLAGPEAMASALANIGALSTTGTAVSATKLATARKIGGVDFDGTKDIDLPFINTTDTNIQLAGNLGVKNLEVHPMPNSSEGGEIDFFDKNDVRAAFLDIDTAGNFRVVVDTLGVAISVNRTNRNVAITSELTVTGNVSAGGGQSLLATTGDVSGPKWGGSLYDYLANRDIGIPIPHPLASVPAGYLKCNGATFSTSTYPKLALKYPSGVLPDLRANAIRGWDDGRGVDAGRVLLSQQDDAIRNITGTFYIGGGKQLAGIGTTGAFGAFNVNASLGQQATGQGDIGGINIDASRVVPTANENRMKNIAFNYIVRAL
ncbi:TPA: phage tail protein [Yersinia enterocolitica]|uniref:phage tail protein n=1 Tax=Yersinia frederiksenii TaxID=29484 RepID=UPI0020CF0F21|nr:phage tail protein [Yersinia frederiksenii]